MDSIFDKIGLARIFSFFTYPIFETMIRLSDHLITSVRTRTNEIENLDLKTEQRHKTI
jgi:hypothetical protein